MSQAPTSGFGFPLTGPKTPTSVATQADESLDALLSSHSGSSRPSYAVAGTIWCNDSVANTKSFYLYDGTSDRLLWSVNALTGEVTMPSDLVLTDPIVSGSLNGGAIGSFRNQIYNGNFVSWLYGTSQTSSGYGSADRWRLLHNGTTKTASRQAFTPGQTDVPGNPKYFLRHVVTSSAGAGNFCCAVQRIEYAETLAGKTATFRVFARAGSGTPNIAVEILQHFGTGGSPSSSVVVDVQTLSLTTDWQAFTFTVNIPSVAGKSFGSDGTDRLEAIIWFDAGSSFDAETNSLGQQSGTFDVSRVFLGECNTTDEDDLFAERPLPLERLLLKRFARVVGGGAGGAFSSSSAFQMHVGNLDMRAAPSASLLTTSPVVYQVGTATRTGSGSSISVANSLQQNSVVLTIDGFSSASTGAPGISRDDIILLSSEL